MLSELALRNGSGEDAMLARGAGAKGSRTSDGRKSRPRGQRDFQKIGF